jgi:hypothetical protein
MPKNVRDCRAGDETRRRRIAWSRSDGGDIHEVLAKTSYHVVSDANGGDAVLTGKVLRWKRCRCYSRRHDGDHQHGAGDGDLVT